MEPSCVDSWRSNSLDFNVILGLTLEFNWWPKTTSNILVMHSCAGVEEVEMPSDFGAFDLKLVDHAFLGIFESNGDAVLSDGDTNFEWQPEAEDSMNFDDRLFDGGQNSGMHLSDNRPHLLESELRL